MVCESVWKRRWLSLISQNLFEIIKIENINVVIVFSNYY